MGRIGLLGGTFDPPHYGHLILGEQAADALGLERVLYIPAADPPHKQGRQKTPVQQRIAMLALAIAGNARFMMSLVDVQRPGPHYSVDMVQLVQAEYPQDELYFVMGGDSLRDLPRWYHPEQLMRLCKFAVMQRPGDGGAAATQHEAHLPGLAERVVTIPSPMVDLSSTYLVASLGQGRSVRYMLPDAVLGYIREQRLYE